MPLSDAFISPAKGNQPRTSIRYANQPCTYSAITKNLLKTFCQTEPPIQLSTIDLESIPDFTKLPFPEHLRRSQKDQMVHDSIVAYATNLATDAVKCSTLKISFHDIDTQHSKDVKPIDNLIKDDIDSFLQGLFQFRRTRAQLCRWTSATYLVMHQAVNSDINSDDDGKEYDKNKWTLTNINLFKDFEKFNLPQMKAWLKMYGIRQMLTLLPPMNKAPFTLVKPSLNSFLVQLFLPYRN